MSNSLSKTLPAIIAVFALCLLALPAHAGLIARYTFDSDLLTDSSGNGYDLTNAGGVTNPSTGLDGGGSASFSGGNTDFLYKTASSTAFNPGTGAFAWSFWYKPASSSATGAIVGHGDFTSISTVDSSSGMAVILGGDNGGIDPDALSFISQEYAPLAAKPAIHTEIVADGPTDGSGTVNDGFHHVIVQRRSTGTVGQLEMWFDGVKQTPALPIDTLASFDSSMAFSIGAHSVEPSGANLGIFDHGIGGVPNGLNFAGEVDEVRIYDMELLPADIAILFGAPVGGGSGEVPEPSSLVLLLLGLLGFSRFRRRRR